MEPIFLYSHKTEPELTEKYSLQIDATEREILIDEFVKLHSQFAGEEWDILYRPAQLICRKKLNS
jgi:hypothetical protein